MTTPEENTVSAAEIEDQFDAIRADQEWRADRSDD